MSRLTALSGVAVLTLAIATPTPTQAGNPAAARHQAVASTSKPVAVSSTGSYIVVMAGGPQAATAPGADLDPSRAVPRAAQLATSHAALLQAVGIPSANKVQDFTNVVDGFSVLLAHDEALRLASLPNVALVLPDEMRFATGAEVDLGGGEAPDDLGRYLGLTARGEAWDRGLTGEGVVVGVIDTGIWPEHPSFADDGTYAPHDPLDASEAAGDPCNFGNVAANPDDEPFVCNNKLLGARQMLATYRTVQGSEPDEFDSARDDDGHGTHTASTAAGNAEVQAVIDGRNVGVVSGVAPRAQVIAYKALGNQGGFTSDLMAAIDQAVADGVDVINYSIGGGPDLISGDAISFLLASAAGVFVAVSAGNDGPDPETLGGPADVPWVTAVGANTMTRFFQGEVRLKNGVTLKGSSLTSGTANLGLVDAEAAGTSDLCLADSLDPALVTGKIVLCRRGGNGRVDKSFEVHRAGGKGMILYNESDDDNLFTDNHWVPTVHLDLTEGLVVKEYIAAAPRPRPRWPIPVAWFRGRARRP